ncbi:MAG: hypothetical protein GKR87_06805 [Kiritimatiellae bacterium]|nr:hypothetical protein [Kiritimatiellia bacterium]
MAMKSKQENIMGQRLKKQGAALIIALWVLIFLSLLISSFAFDMHIEAGISSHYRKRLKADYLARAGIEWAKAVLARSANVNENEELEESANEALFVSALLLSKGVGVRGVQQELGEGRFSVDILPEQGRRNVHKLSDADWREVFKQSNVPEDDNLHDKLIDCFLDWTDNDGDDLKHTYGAESNDSFYRERDYECKNAPLDTVSELGFIKEFTPEILYGGLYNEDSEDRMLGIARLLTTWGENRVNVNTASREVLLTLSDSTEWEWMVDEVLILRKGEDEEAGTRDDGIEADQLPQSAIPEVAGKLTIADRQYLRVISVGEVHNVRKGIGCVFKLGGKKATPIFWNEGALP